MPSDKTTVATTADFAPTVVRDAVDYLQTRPHYVGTLAQPADLLTKPGTASSLEQYGDLLGGIGTCPQTRQLFPGLGG